MTGIPKVSVCQRKRILLWFSHLNKISAKKRRKCEKNNPKYKVMEVVWLALEVVWSALEAVWFGS
jgi:hypothetical protein